MKAARKIMDIGMNDASGGSEMASSDIIEQNQHLKRKRGIKYSKTKRTSGGMVELKQHLSNESSLTWRRVVSGRRRRGIGGVGVVGDVVSRRYHRTSGGYLMQRS